MDINILRAIGMLLLFVTFIGICFMVFSRHRKAYYEAAAQLPFTDDDDWHTTEGEK